MTEQDGRGGINQAITDYYADEDEYVESWILITHRRSTDLEAEGASAVGVMTKTDQSWVTSRGLIEIARESEMFSGRDGYDDE